MASTEGLPEEEKLSIKGGSLWASEVLAELLFGVDCSDRLWGGGVVGSLRCGQRRARQTLGVNHVWALCRHHPADAAKR